MTILTEFLNGIKSSTLENVEFLFVFWLDMLWHKNLRADMTSETFPKNNPSNQTLAFVWLFVLHKWNVYAGYETPDLETQHSAVVVIEHETVKVKQAQMKRTSNMSNVKTFVTAWKLRNM